MKSIRQADKALYFSDASGLNFCLCFEGINGWRLRTSKNATFDSKGAAQMLAQFMGEKMKGSAKVLSYVERGDTLTVSEKGGTSVVLSLGKCFSIAFCDKHGNVITELTDVIADGERLTMKGRLAEKEAIYGGGERFDVTNKRGTAFELYTCDGWNNSGTTYVVIPLFLTTRGGGMFINRNEPAVVDFGHANADTWSYQLQSGDMDCYFYPTGMADALLRYTELTGHAYLPTPWMQGMHICRYGPDFQCFDEDFSYDSFTELDHWKALYILKNEDYISINDASQSEASAADRFFFCNADGTYTLAYVRDDVGKYYKKGPKNSPGGNSVKTIMENFIRTDIKPDAASMENYAWYKAFDDRNPNPAHRAKLVQTVNWLHAHGMHGLVYIGCGRTVREHKGFKEEYLVHADVEFQNADGTVTRHENTTQIPWVVGTGENPDVWRANDGRYRAETYLDITNDEALEWYFDQIWGELINIGIDGVKIDFCEELPNHGKLCGTCVTYYRWKNPSKITAGTEHHAYPTYYISAFYKRMLEHKAARGLKDGFMVFSRGGGIGSQRSPYMWAGDQARKHEKLRDQLLAVVNSGLSGVPFMSYDMAGYQYWGESYYTIGLENESAIFARAIEFTAFLTQMQTHGDVRHAYEMTEGAQQIYRNFTRLHTELIPYMQKYSKIACDTGMPPVRHLVLKYMDDVKVHDLIDEFMLGDGILVAPILTGDTWEREVYLPAGSWTDMLTGEVIEGGKTVVAKANLGQIPVYLNNDSADKAELLPIFEGQNWNQIKNWK